VLLTRSPLEHPRRGLSARLACVKHAASVRPEPGSNSPTKTRENPSKNTTTNKTIGTGLSSTLLSSQRTTTHLKPTHHTASRPPGHSFHFTESCQPCQPVSPGYCLSDPVRPLPERAAPLQARGRRARQDGRSGRTASSPVSPPRDNSTRWLRARQTRPRTGR
jgi:hypothetical protein